MIDVVWRMYNPDAYPGSMKPQTTICLPPWAGIPENAEKVAEEVLEDFFKDDDVWDEWFGFDATSADVMVEITEPACARGHYAVDLELVVKARATKALPP